MALDSLESISYERCSFLISYLASTDTNSFFFSSLFLVNMLLNSVAQPVSMDRRPRRNNSQMPLS